MKKGIIGLFVVLSCLSYSQEEQKISLQGHGNIQIQPDRAEIQFTVATSDVNLNRATLENEKIMNKLESKLKELKIEKKNIKTIGYNVFKEEQNDNKKTDLKYNVRNSFMITLENMDKIGDTISNLESIGINEVGGVRFYSTKSEEKTKEAMVLAYKDAYEKGKAVAKAAGYNEIQPVDINYDYIPMGRPLGVSFAQMKQSTQIYAPETLDLDVVVRVVFTPNN